MAKIRVTKPGEVPNKKRFKRKQKLKKIIFYMYIFLTGIYVVYKENLIQLLIDFCNTLSF